MSLNPNVNIRSFTLKANQTDSVNAGGTFILFYGNTGPFQFAFDGGSMQDGTSILAIDTARGTINGLISPDLQVVQRFSRITFQDKSGSGNTINFIVADFPVTYINPLPTVLQKDAPTYIKPSGAFNLTDGQLSTAYSGTDTGGQTRKHFIVANPAGNPTVYAAKSDGTLGDGCPAGQSRIYATSGAVYVQNTIGSGPANGVTVMEIFYV